MRPRQSQRRRDLSHGPSAAAKKGRPAAAVATRAESDSGEDTELADAVALLQAAADPVRLSVLRLLATASACVCDLQQRVPIPASLLSYHLRILREAGLVTAHRRGRWIDYALSDDAGTRLQATLPTNPRDPVMGEDTGTMRHAHRPSRTGVSAHAP